MMWIKSLATALHSDGNIPHRWIPESVTKEIYDNVIDPRSRLSASEKACDIISGIRRRVDQSPTDFHKLKGYLRENKTRNQHILKLLEETYSATELSSCDSQASAFPPRPQAEHVIGEDYS